IGAPGGAWQAGAQAAAALRLALDASAKAGSLDGRLDEVRRQTEALRASLAELRRPLVEDEVEAQIKAARRPAAGAGAWRALDALLATALVPPGQRAAVWETARDLTGRLEEETYRLDRRDWGRAVEPPAKVAGMDGLLAAQQR